MAHVELPQEELEPLIQSMKKVFDPLIKAMPSLALIPTELERIGDKLDQDMMSGIPERMESVAEKFSMDFGSRMLAIYDKVSFKAQKFQESIELAKQRDERNRQDRLEKFREQGLAVEMKNNRVQFISEKDLQKKQAENIKTQKVIIKKEKELQKLVEKGEKGSEENIAKLIQELTVLQKKEGEQSQELGDKRKEAKGVLGTIRAGAESVLPGPIMAAFDDFGSNIAEVGNNLKSFGKPFMALGKVVDKRFGITEKLQKLEVKQFALKVKAFAVEKAKFALDMLAVLTNPFALITIAITAFIGTLYAFNDEIKAFINGIGESIANFGKSIYNAFANSAIGKFFNMEPYDMGEEKETPAQIEAQNVSANVEAAGPLGALAQARETGTQKLDRLKGEASQMAQEKLASNIVNIANSNQANTSLTAEVKVPKSNADNALALNPT